MKKLISLVAALALVGSVAAAPKKPAKPAAKPAVAAPAVPATVAAVAAKSSAPTGGSKFVINAWGGYSINGKSDLTSAADGYADTTANSSFGFTSKSNDLKTQGVAGGLDFWYGDKFQFGVGAYYLQGFKSTKTMNFGSNGTTTNTTQFNYIPIVAQIRFFVFEGIYVGAGAGVALVNGAKSESSATFALTGLPYSDTYTGTAIWTEGRIGYNLKLTDVVGLDVFGIFSYQINTASFKNVVATGSGTASVTAADVKGNAFNITPALALSLRF